MSKMDYRKVALQTRIQYEEHEYGNQESDGWDSSQLPKYKGLTFQEIFFRDLPFLLRMDGNLTRGDGWNINTAQQVARVVTLARMIRPEKPNKEFLIIDRFSKEKGIKKLKEIKLVGKGVTPRGYEKYRIRRRRTLSVDMLREYPVDRKASAKFIRFLEECFFQGERPTAKQCSKFFYDLLHGS